MSEFQSLGFMVWGGVVLGLRAFGLNLGHGHACAYCFGQPSFYVGPCHWNEGLQGQRLRFPDKSCSAGAGFELSGMSSACCWPFTKTSL